MTIGRTDDPENPFCAAAFEAASLLGTGSRIPSGPADMAPRREGRTHDRNRPACQTSHFSLASERPSTHGTEGGSPNLAPLKALELPHRPSHERQIDVSEHGLQRRSVVSPVVPDPPPKEWIEHTGDVIQLALWSVVGYSSPAPSIVWFSVPRG